jgi:hypothetical protein
MFKNTFHGMGRHFIFFILIGFVLFAGCTNYVSNLTAPKQNLQINKTALFEQDTTAFRVSIDSVTMRSPTPEVHTINVHFTVKNSGKKTISLMAYPKLSDDSGKEYPGKGVFLGAMNPGGITTGESSITIDSKEDYAALQKRAVLMIRFQGAQPTPWEAGWDLDIDTLT